jgi:hypothetical protein
VRPHASLSLIPRGSRYLVSSPETSLESTFRAVRLLSGAFSLPSGKFSVPGFKSRDFAGRQADPARRSASARRVLLVLWEDLGTWFQVPRPRGKTSRLCEAFGFRAARSPCPLGSSRYLVSSPETSWEASRLCEAFCFCVARSPCPLGSSRYLVSSPETPRENKPTLRGVLLLRGVFC